MKTNALEKLHRSIISKMNKPRSRWDIIYYKDVEIESAILPLVELLNNEWSLTTHACGGHWDPKPRFQHPYVSFYVFANRSVWRGIVRNTWQVLEPELGGKFTIQIEDDYLLPELWAKWSCWRFRPKITGVGTSSWEKSHNIFRSEKAFRRELDWLIGKTFSALRAEMDKERKRGRSSVRSRSGHSNHR